MPDEIFSSFTEIRDILTALDKDGPAPRVAKVLDKAIEEGWRLNPPGGTFVLRLTKDGDLAKPFYVSWAISVNAETGKKSWRFRSAYASNGQAMNYGDVLIYLGDQSVIHPEPEGESSVS